MKCPKPNFSVPLQLQLQVPVMAVFQLYTQIFGFFSHLYVIPHMKVVTESIKLYFQKCFLHFLSPQIASWLRPFLLAWFSCFQSLLFLVHFAFYGWTSYSAARVIENWIFGECCGLVFKDLLILSLLELSDLSQHIHFAMKATHGRDRANSYLFIYDPWFSGLPTSLGHIFHCSVLTSNLATSMGPSLVVLPLRDDFSVPGCPFSLTLL